MRRIILSKKEIQLERKTFKFKNNDLFLTITQYSNNNRLAILCETEDELYCDLTINLSNTFPLNKNEAHISDIAKTCGLEKALLDAGIIKEVICEEKYNYGTYDFVSFDMNKLKEYDPVGLDNYYKSFNYEPHYIPKI